MTLIPIDKKSIKLNKNCMPRKYRYCYLVTEVVCKSCNTKFSHTKLEYNKYHFNICPFCGKIYCCPIEHEQLSNEQFDKLLSHNIIFIE